MVIALVRHGQTDWNLALRMQGRTDIPLNATGREQARTAARRLADGGWDLVVSSPLVRARETAEILADGIRAELGGTDDDLIEEEFGEAEGMLVAAVAERWPDGDIPGREPVEHVAARGLAALGRLADAYEGRNVLAVAHGTLIRTTLAAISGHDRAHFPKLDNVSSSHVHRVGADWSVLTVGGVEFAIVRAEVEARAAELAALAG
ncbi:histidine phosphatase family protein [Agromyces sp. G08B096]|uniref:Histidine phosphatase family protein n=1 Tax=Agromyces sp. G08B096 TaxID=3156399 RepID=A0AAU7W534_9MICO